MSGVATVIPIHQYHGWGGEFSVATSAPFPQPGHSTPNPTFPDPCKVPTEYKIPNTWCAALSAVQTPTSLGIRPAVYNPRRISGLCFLFMDCPTMGERIRGAFPTFESEDSSAMLFSCVFIFPKAENVKVGGGPNEELPWSSHLSITSRPHSPGSCRLRISEYSGFAPWGIGRGIAPTLPGTYSIEDAELINENRIPINSILGGLLCHMGITVIISKGRGNVQRLYAKRSGWDVVGLLLPQYSS
ncbi:hypothetical protein Tco_0757475 [Tanacetum coccineum]